MEIGERVLPEPWIDQIALEQLAGNDDQRALGASTASSPTDHAPSGGAGMRTGNPRARTPLVRGDALRDQEITNGEMFQARAEERAQGVPRCHDDRLPTVVE